PEFDDGLLERTSELAMIIEAVECARGGDGSLLVLEGPAGIGKTRLLDATRLVAGEQAFRMYGARGGELERDFAYGVVRQLFERVVVASTPDERAVLLTGPAVHAGAALGLEAVPGRPATDDPSFAVRHGLYWLVSNLAATGPVMLTVDDAQWADAPSLRFLAYLARRLEGLPVLVAITARTGDAPADETLLAELTTESHPRRLTPAPLSSEAAREVLTARTGMAVENGFADACHAATGGNPFLLGELASALLEDAIAPVLANVSRVAELGPRTIARAIVMRLGRVSPESVRYARAVSVLGVSADARHAADLAGLTEVQGRDAYDALAASGVLARERPLRFAHPIIREAVYRELPPAEREGMHVAAAELLVATGAPASEIAAHLLATPPRGSSSTVAALREAAEVALGQGAADLAARYLRRALAEPPQDQGRGEVLGQLGRAEWLAGEDLPGAVAHLREALALTKEPQARTELAIGLARAAFSTGDVDGAGAVLEDELAAPGDATRDQILLMEAEFGSIRLLHGASPELARRIERFAKVPGDTIPELLLLTNAASMHWLHGDADACASLAERSLGEGRAVAATGGDSIAVLQALWVLTYAERHELATRTVEDCIAEARRTGSVFGLTASHGLAAIIAYRKGELQRCEAEARSALELPGIPPFNHPTVHIYLALALTERGELDEAEAVMDRSWVGPYLPLLVHMNPGFYARGLLRIAQGRLEEARDDLLEAGARDARVYNDNPGIPWRAAAARVLCALGEEAEARRLAADHLVHARRWGTPGAIGVALHAQALVTGRDPSAIAEAVAVLEGSPARLDHAHALVDLGAAQRASNARAEAKATLRTALDLARRCGAMALVRRAHDELITAGARPRRLQFSGLEALTASERRICDLAQSGRTNREIAQQLFVTPKTVENHLGRAYVKLGIGSREALANVLAASE
ncbi:MAG: AAA family ATPase, partial [Solirubrobacteraceae bacterium]